jgi:hypothetical protein
VLLNLLNPDGSPLPDETVRLLYNACELGVSTSMGEGWGLGTFEHAATGAAQIAPDHTTFSENWHGAAALAAAGGVGPCLLWSRQARPQGCWTVAGDWRGGRSRSSL